jgi:hypothetical protein
MLHNIYSDQVKGGEMGKYVTSIGEMRNAYKILVTKPEGTRPLRRPKSRREDNIRIDLREIWWESMEWIHLAQNRDQRHALVNTVMNLWVS